MFLKKQTATITMKKKPSYICSLLLERTQDFHILRNGLTDRAFDQLCKTDPSFAKQVEITARELKTITHQLIMAMQKQKNNDKKTLDGEEICC